MSGSEIDDFAAAVRARETFWRNNGVRSRLRFGAPTNKPAATLDCALGDREAQLTVWDGGEAELVVGDMAIGAVFTMHYEVAEPGKLDACLDDLYGLLTDAD